ncbi:CCR4-NOT transcription complex subunit 10 isoform X1 [Patella vulgata]|uniref:CCR4-NOT transcription complex subunit 10 isoform X1 n=1 Tax=Patella vulgata TaxID=6465 RepID=UPI00217F68E2|nr:CCR4-NOT transcription complex subunit 10 isoform X1 [Patella vulgata]
MNEPKYDENADMPSIPAITPSQSDLMKLATQEFDKKNFPAAFSLMGKLAAQRTTDPKVLHNKVVAEFYQSGLKNKDDFNKNLQSVCKLIRYGPRRLSSETEALEDVDQTVIFYNQSVLLYHHRQYKAALEVLEKVVPSLEPLVSLYPTEENLSRKCVLLLVELYLCTYQPEKAMGRIAYFEKTYFIGKPATQMTADKPTSSGGGERSDSSVDALRYKIGLYKTRCLLMFKSLKSSKRELKALLAIHPNQQPLSVTYLKCYLDFLRGNYKKAMKGLSGLPQTQVISEHGECLTMMYYNNLACIHFQMKKHHLGALHLRKSLQENENAIKDPRYTEKDRPLNMMGMSRHYELLYNMGIQLLHCGKSQPAFDCLIQAVQVYQTNPRLWLRLAECCIQYNRENNDEDRKLEKRLEVIQGSVGNGIHRKLILGPGLKKEKQSSGSSAIPAPTYEFASLCLRNALFLLPEDPLDFDTAPSPDNVDASKSQQDMLMVPAPPGNPMRSVEVANLRCSILCAAAYVSLSLNDHLMALNYAKNLLRQPRISGAQRYLGNLYMAEVLVILDRISDAVNHLKPEDLEVINPCPPEEKTDKSEKEKDEPTEEKGPLYPWSPKEMIHAKKIMQYNLAVTYAIRGDFDKSNANLSESVAAIGTPLPAQMFFLKLYLDLMEGRRITAQNVIKDHFGHMTPNRVENQVLSKSSTNAWHDNS